MMMRKNPKGVKKNQDCFGVNILSSIARNRSAVQIASYLFKDGAAGGKAICNTFTPETISNGHAEVILL